jgi:hypothetical protein
MMSAEKKFKERFKDYEPYELNEIREIIQKVKKRPKKDKIGHKLDEFRIVQEKINLIIKNSELIYQILENEESIDDPDGYYSELEHINQLKRQFEREIAKLQLEIAREADSTVKPEDGKPKIKISSGMDTSTLTSSASDEIFTVKEIAKVPDWNNGLLTLNYFIGESQINRKIRFPKRGML